MSDMQITIRLWWETGLDPTAILAFRQVIDYFLLNKTDRLPFLIFILNLLFHILFTINYSLLFDSPFIQCLRILCCILQVFAVCLCEVMGAGEIFFGTHIYIIMVDTVQYSIDTLY